MTDADAAAPTRIYIDLIGDLFHAGHLRHLEKAAKLGNILVVGVFDDETAARLSHVPVVPLDERVAILAALRCVHEIIPGAPAAPDIAFLDKYDIESICLSDDYGDAERQSALANLMDEGAGIVLPYVEDITTSRIVARISGIDETPTPAAPSNTAKIHMPDSKQTGRDQVPGAYHKTVLDALSALAAGVFGRRWLLNREQLGDDVWISLLKCMAGNATARETHRDTDPRFVPALVSLSERFSRPGDRINLIGAAAPLVGAALGAKGWAVTVIQPAMTGPVERIDPESTPYKTVHCGWFDLPAACPPADILTVMDTAWSNFLIIDAGLLCNATLRLKRDLILCVNFWPENSGSLLPMNDHGDFAFSDTYIRNVLHTQGFFEVEDVLTLIDGAPKPDGSPGCDRVSRVQIVEKEDKKDGFRYLDGGEVISTGSPQAGKYIRWYRASKQSLTAGPA